MFNETITSADNETTTGTATEAHALSLLRRPAVRRGCRMEATRTGGVIITRQVWTGDVLPKQRTIALEPVKPVARLTTTTREDLDAVLAASGAYLVEQAEREFRARVGRIGAGITGIAPAAAARLVDRGLLVLGEPYADTSNGYLPERRRPVKVSLAARLAMLAQAHRTETTQPAGWVKPSDMGYEFIGRDRHGGRTYVSTSAARCSCHGWSQLCEDRDDARRKARGHREQVTAELVESLRGN